jgi:hypothetical protein
MSEKKVDQRVLADLREWIGVSEDKVSDDELLKESGSVRQRLEFHYALRDCGTAIVEEFNRFILFLRGKKS